jgi:hypothetical protein
MRRLLEREQLAFEQREKDTFQQGLLKGYRISGKKVWLKRTTR